MDTTVITNFVSERLASVAMQVVGALLLWLIGRWLIGFTMSWLGKGLTRQRVDPTLIRYVTSTVAVLLNLVLVMGVLEYFGVRTTTFAALLAAAGLAIGTAWGGLLANFAAGAFLVILRPFKVGEFVSAGGVTGTVEEIGMFVTTFNSPDNIRTYVGNNKIFSDTIQNFSSNPFRRVDLVAQISGGADPHLAITRLKERISAIKNVLPNPAPDVVILQFTPAGPVLAVRPYCHNDHYWQVYFDANMAIREVLGDGTFPAPMPAFSIRNA